MFPSKLLPQKPSAYEQTLIEQLATQLLCEHMPAFQQRDSQGLLLKAAKVFKKHLRDALREQLRLLDRRSVVVELHVTPHHLPTHWYVEVHYDTRSRGMYHSVLIPVTIHTHNN